jgi:TnpA family transposase
VAYSNQIVIRFEHGYQDFSKQPGHWRLVRWLYGRAWVGSESPSVLFDLATARLVEHKILLPGVTVLERLVMSVRERAANLLWRMLFKLPSAEQRLKLEPRQVSWMSLSTVVWKTPESQICRLVSDQFTGFHALVVPGTLRDSLVVLVGLLEQETSLSPKEIMTDTAGYSDVVFGLFWLLGYQFSPRLADVGEARFWRLDQTANYGVLDGIARQKVNISLIENHWDDMLRVAGSLKLGMVSATDIMRTLSPGDKPSVLGRAIGELGRIAKTLYLLNYVDDEAYRRRILTQLNRGEGRHALARVTFHGPKGELRQRYREGQEDQLSALGLVVNASILWNTYYMDAALTSLRQEQSVSQEDLARLSPLGHAHINMLGRYQFSLPLSVIEGKMRPLRDPNDSNDLDD